MTNPEPIIEVQDIKLQFNGAYVHNGLSLTVNRGEILAIIGGSGCGKTTLLREILLLQRPNSGSIKVFGQELMTANYKTLLEVQKRWGVMFQQNALFSSLTILENVSFPLQEHTNLDADTIRELALLKILLVGLPIETANKFPSELSGGMEKRAALARAIVLDPELLFFDEPSAGLDPDSAAALDELILNLQATLGLTIVIVTHDLDSLWTVTNRVAFLGDKKVLCVAPMQELVKNPDPRIQDYFTGPRGRVATETYQKHGS